MAQAACPAKGEQAQAVDNRERVERLALGARPARAAAREKQREAVEPHTGNGWREWHWRAHRPGKRWRGHGWSVGLGRCRGWGRSDRHGRHAARSLGRQWSLGRGGKRRKPGSGGATGTWIGRRERLWIGRQLWRLRSGRRRGAKRGVRKDADASERDHHHHEWRRLAKVHSARAQRLR
jgi:hypothetical protein